MHNPPLSQRGLISGRSSQLWTFITPAKHFMQSWSTLREQRSHLSPQKQPWQSSARAPRPPKGQGESSGSPAPAGTVQAQGCRGAVWFVRAGTEAASKATSSPQEMGWAAWACRKENLTAGILTLDILQRKMLYFTGKKYFSLALESNFLPRKKLDTYKCWVSPETLRY